MGGMDLLTVFRNPAQICAILSSERFNPPSTSTSSISSSLLLIAPSRLTYPNRWKNPRVRYKTLSCLGPSQSNGGDAEETNNPDNENFSAEERAISDIQNDLPAFRTRNSGSQLSQEQLREVLNTLSQSLTVLSSALSEVTSAVRVLSASLSAEPQQADTLVLPSKSSETPKDAAAGADDMFDSPAEPWDTSTMPTIPTRNVDEIVDGRIDTESSVPQYLVEQNRVTHTLAYRLQQSFIQARVDGLGKPSEVALEEFVDTCMEAHRKGIGLKELQLQLILQDGSLAGAFSLRSQRFSNDPIFDENSRIRSLWVRLVYSTLAELEEMEKPAQGGQSSDEKAGEIDGTETFVKQVIKGCFEEGYDLARIKLEQNFAGESTSPSIKAMRQNHYLVLLVVDKLQKSKQDRSSRVEKQDVEKTSTDEKEDDSSIDEAN